MKKNATVFKRTRIYFYLQGIAFLGFLFSQDFLNAMTPSVYTIIEEADNVSVVDADKTQDYNRKIDGSEITFFSNKSDSEPAQKKNKRLNSTIIEARASYFQPFSKTFRKLTGGGVDYGLEITIPISKRWNIWGGVDYFSKSGTMIGINRSVHITMVPITFGLKYIYLFNRYYGLYAGGGGKYYFVEQINRASSMPRTTHRSGLGGVVEVGNLICFNHFVIDIFSSWSFKKIHGPHHLPPNATSESMQVGGWNIGGGLGYKF